MRVLVRVLLAAGLLLAGTGAAAAKEGHEVDCGDVAMKFTAPGFKVTCKDYSDSTALSNSGGTRVELLSALADDRQTILVAVDLRALGGIYLKRRGFAEEFRDTFSGEGTADWKETDKVQGYEFAEYTGNQDDECVAFRRGVNLRAIGDGRSGFGRIVIGYGCATGGRQNVIDTLKLLDAPGD